MYYTYICNSTKKDAKMGPKNKKKIFWIPPTTLQFFGSLVVPEYEKNGDHALSVAKILCRTN